ncbi:hypothetical protein Gpo141_00004774 [Globisporangium polare]
MPTLTYLTLGSDPQAPQRIHIRLNETVRELRRKITAAHRDIVPFAASCVRISHTPRLSATDDYAEEENNAEKENDDEPTRLPLTVLNSTTTLRTCGSDPWRTSCKPQPRNPATTLTPRRCRAPAP